MPKDCAAVIRLWRGGTWLLAFLFFCTALPAISGQRELKYVVILTRHGVRSPIWEKDRLSQYAAEPWPDWQVPPGYLTPHGRALVKLMGAYYHGWLTGEGLLPRSGCEGAAHTYIWADTDERTIETGSALAETLAPGCAITVHSLPQGDKDPLFDPTAAGVAKPDRAVAAKAVRDRLQILPGREPFDLLERVLVSTTAEAPKPVAFAEEVAVTESDQSVELTGSVAAASTLGEDLLLEYANGWSGAQLGWGRLTVADLRRILELHAAYGDLTRRTPYLARAAGSNLLAHILRSMEQAATGQPTPEALGTPGGAVLILSGHDTNISNVAGMLGLSWTLPGYPANETPPGGALVFELWREASGGYAVSTRYLAQTLEQMHDATPLSLAAPPGIANVPVPGCAENEHAACPWSDFERAMQSAIDEHFVAAGNLRK